MHLFFNHESIINGGNSFENELWGSISCCRVADRTSLRFALRRRDVMRCRIVCMCFVPNVYCVLRSKFLTASYSLNHLLVVKNFERIHSNIWLWRFLWCIYFLKNRLKYLSLVVPIVLFFGRCLPYTLADLSRQIVRGAYVLKKLVYFVEYVNWA